ncbi:MAG: hypothetical protein ACPL1Z_07190 [Candidatus Bathyarchaeales archaeon]|nr:MAG: hypothetical protein C0199_01225 [Candidatus Bathyarchaeota archaeon]
MPKNTGGYGFHVALALSLSLIGIALVLPLVVYKPTVHFDVSWRKPLIGSLLTLICIAGVLAVFFPEKCTKTLHRRKRDEELASDVKNASSYSKSISFRGHHPDCGKFAAHLIHVKGRVFCAACTGLLLGALFVLAGTVLYFFINWNFLGLHGLWAVFVGQVGVALGLFQFKFRGFTRSVLNAFFVIACFLILAGVDTFAENVLFDLYLICLTIFWLFTRILTSQWNHLQICRACSVPCELKR